jgi:hypothetical protein
MIKKICHEELFIEFIVEINFKHLRQTMNQIIDIDLKLKFIKYLIFWDFKSNYNTLQEKINEKLWLYQSK